MKHEDMWHSRHSGSRLDGCRVWPARPVVGASGTSWHLTVPAVPGYLSCGHKSQRHQRTLHTVIVAIEGNVGITGIILGVIIIIFRVIFGVIRILFGSS